MDKNLIKYGAIGAAVYVLANVIFWQVDLSLYLNGAIYVPHIAALTFCILGQVKARDIAGGFIEYGQALGVFVINSAIALLGHFATLFIVFNIIDPEAKQTILDLTIEQTITMTEKMGGLFGVDISSTMDPEMLREMMQNQPNPMDASSILLSFIFTMIFFLIVGLISSAVIKKNEPAHFD